MPDEGLRARHDALVADRSLTGEAWCGRYSEACDDWLAGLFARASAGFDRPLALLAVGGYGLGEMAPGSDLDLVLLHDANPRKHGVGAVAEALWYPIWDEGVHLDHSVRSAKEVRATMEQDRKVGLGLLTARVVAGDGDLAAKVTDGALDLWKRRAGRWLPEVAEIAAARHAAQGDVAFLLEPDLKEGRGGIRDLRLLDATSRVSPVLADVAGDPELRSACGVLTAARVELQRSTGKGGNVLLLQEQDVVAAALGYVDADVLMADVAHAARTLAWANDDGWRRVGSWLRGPRGRGGSGDDPLEPGLVRRDEEIALVAGADPARDPSLALRASAASAELDLPLARASLDRLAAETAGPPTPWPRALRQAFVRLLGAGRPAINAIEALDGVGVWGRLLPEWDPVRNHPQRNAFHRFTVDRHLLEAVANASDLVRTVDRPDLLLVGTLLHDIGKARGGDHTEIGVAIVESLGPRMGFAPGDVTRLVAMVRLHLLLPDVATRRDLNDPVTIQGVADEVGDTTTLGLLAALTEADSLATGPSAWGPWKARLVGELVERVGRELAGHPPLTPTVEITDEERRLVASGALTFVASDEDAPVPVDERIPAAEDHRDLRLVAPDRDGLLATVAGVLSLRGVAIRQAITRAGETRADDGTAMAVIDLHVIPAIDRFPDWDRVREDLSSALEGRLRLDERLAERERAYARRRRVQRAAPVRVRLDLDNDAASDRTVVDVRAPDRGPVLYRVASAITAAGVEIDSARVSTLGAEVVDVFYVTGPGGGKLDPDGELATAMRDRIEAALRPPGDDPSHGGPAGS